MRIAIISTHSFPIGLHGPITKTGDVVIMDLVRSLAELGHEVSFFTPEGGFCPPNVKIYPMMCSFGKYPPSAEDCETDCFNKYTDILKQQDIIHDFSSGKIISQNLSTSKKTIITLMGGAWLKTYKPTNLIAWSNSHKERLSKGYTDFYGTPTPNLAGSNGMPVDSHVVNGGVDIDFYSPDGSKKNFFLFVGRWHDVRGYKLAIELAKQTDIELVMAGEHPDNEMFEYQKNCAKEAIELGKNISNIHFEWLPFNNPDHHITKRNLFRQARALILPTQFCEPFGLTMAEGLACKTPIISTNFGSMPEIIKHEETGFVCENNINSFINAINKINKINIDNCREDAVQRFDRKVMANTYIKEYQMIIEGSIW